MAVGGRLQLNHQGIRTVLRSQGVQTEMKKLGRKIAAAAGPGNEVEAFTGANRGRITIRTATDEAKIAEQTRQALSKAAKGGR